MIEKGKHDEAKEIIKRFYKEEYVDEVLEYTSEYEASQVDPTPENKNPNEKK